MPNTNQTVVDKHMHNNENKS